MRRTVLWRLGVLLGLVVGLGLTTATSALAARQVVLGSADFAPNGTGSGTPHPPRIYNGGDPNGSVFGIHWYSWGGHTAFGVGKQPMFKPTGGYYRLPVIARLHAVARGRCYRGGPLTYTRMYVRSQIRPGGPFGWTYLWSDAHSLCKGYP